MHWKQFQLARESEALEGKADQGALLVLMVVISHADNKTAIAFPGEETIARESRMTTRGVREILVKLTSRGFLSRLKGGNGRGLDEYLCHVEQGRTAENNRNGDAIKPKHGSGLIDERIINNRNGDAGNEKITGTVTHLPTEITGTVTQPYKDEGKNKDLKSDIEEREARANLSPENSQSEPPLETDFLPFVDDARDARFQSPFYFAILKVCELDPDLVFWKKKQEAAMVAMTLKNKGYTIEQIVLGGSRWPFPTAPEPLQFQSRFPALLNQKTKPEKAPASDFERQWKEWNQQQEQLTPR